MVQLGNAVLTGSYTKNLPLAKASFVVMHANHKDGIDIHPIMENEAPKSFEEFIRLCRNLIW